LKPSWATLQLLLLYNRSLDSLSNSPENGFPLPRILIFLAASFLFELNLCIFSFTALSCFLCIHSWWFLVLWSIVGLNPKRCSRQKMLLGWILISRSSVSRSFGYKRNVGFYQAIVFIMKKIGFTFHSHESCLVSLQLGILVLLQLLKDGSQESVSFSSLSCLDTSSFGI
jgi:hypothetical protein